MTQWWRGAVIYQIYPRSFQDSNGDGIGDLAGITRRLAYVASLGVDAIWLSPFFPSPDKDMGYDVTDYTGVAPRYGTLEDFDALVAEAHRLGLKVIIDQVLSHTSDKHPWFAESRASRDNAKSDWYVWADARPDGTPPNNWLSVFGGSAWQWDTRRKQYYLHNFMREQPDLNFHNPDVLHAILDAMRFWLERGVDGFRLDTVNFYVHDETLRDNPPANLGGIPTNPYEMQEHLCSKTQPENIDVLRRFRALTDEFPGRTMVGEVGELGRRQIEIMGEYTSGDDKLHMAYSFAMLNHEHSAGHFRRCLEGFAEHAPDGWPCWSFSNHDVMRHVSRWAREGEAEAVAKQSIALLTAFPGTIGIYQGEELGLTETDIEWDELQDVANVDFWPEYKGRDGCRTPMVWEREAPNAGFSDGTPWLPVKAPQAARALDVQEGRNDSVLSAYRSALAFRRGRAELRAGTTRFLDLPEPLLGIVREADGRSLTCLFNLSGEAQRVDLAEAAQPVGPQEAELVEGGLVLPPHGHVYLEAAEAVSLTVDSQREAA